MCFPEKISSTAFKSSTDFGNSTVVKTVKNPNTRNSKFGFRISNLNANSTLCTALFEHKAIDLTINLP